MKNTFYTLITLIVLSSCGPHRMSCGARGICKSPEKLEKLEKRFTVKV